MWMCNRAAWTTLVHSLICILKAICVFTFPEQRYGALRSGGVPTCATSEPSMTVTVSTLFLELIVTVTFNQTNYIVI